MVKEYFYIILRVIKSKNHYHVQSKTVVCVHWYISGHFERHLEHSLHVHILEQLMLCIQHIVVRHTNCQSMLPGIGFKSPVV